MYTIPNNQINYYKFNKKSVKYNDKDWDRIISIGDIHGCYNKLINLLNQVKPTNKDLLIFHGDYTDRGENNVECMRFVLKMVNYKNIIFLLGNHELMLLEHIIYNMGYIRKINMQDIKNMSLEEFKILFNEMRSSTDYYHDYLPNGGSKTLSEIVRKNEYQLFKDYLCLLVRLYTKFEMNINNQHTIFVHAGINPFKDLDKQILTDLVWIRWEFFDNYKSKAKVVIGHTPTQNINGDNKPIILPNNIIMVDTGSWRSCISAFNINDNNYWQDTVKVKVKELK